MLEIGNRYKRADTTLSIRLGGEGVKGGGVNPTSLGEGGGMAWPNLNVSNKGQRYVDECKYKQM